MSTLAQRRWHTRVWRREVGLFCLAACLAGGLTGSLLCGLQALFCPYLIQDLVSMLGGAGVGKTIYTASQAAAVWSSYGLLWGVIFGGNVILMLFLHFLLSTYSEITTRQLFRWLPCLLGVVAALWAASGVGLMVVFHLAPQLPPFRALALYPYALGVWWIVGSTMGGCLGMVTALGLFGAWCVQMERNERLRAASPVRL